MDQDEILLDAEERMEKAVQVVKDQLQGLRTGRANAGLVDSVRVNYYGSPTPLKQLATISIPEPQQILIDALQARHWVLRLHALQHIRRLGDRHIERSLAMQRIHVREIAVGRCARHGRFLGDFLQGGLTALLQQARSGLQEVLARSAALVGATDGVVG